MPEPHGSLGQLAVAEDERYVTRDELAAIMGVSVDTIDRLRRAGMPSVVWSVRSRRFLPSVAIAWARAHDGRSLDEVVAVPGTIAAQQDSATRRVQPAGRRATRNQGALS